MFFSYPIFWRSFRDLQQLVGLLFSFRSTQLSPTWEACHDSKLHCPHSKMAMNSWKWFKTQRFLWIYIPIPHQKSHFFWGRGGKKPPRSGFNRWNRSPWRRPRRPCRRLAACPHCPKRRWDRRLQMSCEAMTISKGKQITAGWEHDRTIHGIWKFPES